MRHADLLEKISGYNKYLANGKFRSLDFFIQSTYVDVVGSREVAKLVERPHNDLMKSIRTYADYISTAGDFSLSDFFILSSYKDSTGRTLPCYLLTKKGCDMAADVCRALELGNSRQALTRLDEDEKGVISNDTLGGKQSLNIVNEPGLYSLVLGSQ